MPTLLVAVLDDFFNITEPVFLLGTDFLGIKLLVILYEPYVGHVEAVSFNFHLFKGKEY